MAHSILLVDDDAVIRTLLTEYLESLSYEVHAFASGPEALAGIESIRCELIVCDLQMPGMDGLSLLEQLQEKEAYTSLPVIMLSANKGTQELISQHNVVVSSLIAKPFDVHVVRDTIEALLKG